MFFTPNSKLSQGLLVFPNWMGLLHVHKKIDTLPIATNAPLKKTIISRLFSFWSDYTMKEHDSTIIVTTRPSHTDKYIVERPWAWTWAWFSSEVLSAVASGKWVCQWCAKLRAYWHRWSLKSVRKVFMAFIWGSCSSFYCCIIILHLL